MVPKCDELENVILLNLSWPTVYAAMGAAVDTGINMIAMDEASWQEEGPLYEHGIVSVTFEE